MKFMDKLNNCRPAPGQLGIFWLGQAGFLLKNSKGELWLWTLTFPMG